jgi:triphosphoribosyl-dephospho-CoA synthase
MNYHVSEFTTINAVAEAVWWACITELEALKPGNVSVYAGGHRMTVDDFAESACCVANILGSPGLRVGEQILKSIEATRATVGCNTNLGIVLLCAPLAHSALALQPAAAAPGATTFLRQRLAATLRGLDMQDTQQVFHAIRLAQPGGLGHSEQHDVHQPVAVDLLVAMRAAEQRDRIAWQYVNDFADVFDYGLAVFRGALARGLNEVWAAVEVYLNFLTRFQDTHIRRKLGEATAAIVQHEARHWLERFRQSRAPQQQMTGPLLEFDDSLKQRGINPGTSADLTVATLLAYRLLQLEQQDFEQPDFGMPASSDGNRLFSEGVLSKPPVV